MAKTKTFEVQARLNLLTTITIEAQSLEEAMAKSKTLKEGDFVNFEGEFMDGGMRITGLYESYPL